MICPHCKKPFPIGRNPASEDMAKDLLRQGYNIRETQIELQNKGFAISVTTIMKIKRDMK